jgi:hypothetical protein
MSTAGVACIRLVQAYWSTCTCTVQHKQHHSTPPKIHGLHYSRSQVSLILVRQ